MNSGSNASPWPRRAASRMAWPLLLLKRPRGETARGLAPGNAGSKVQTWLGVALL